MANGYVPRFMRPDPLNLQRRSPRPPQPATHALHDPAALFTTKSAPQCMFPVQDGPNPIQRFWIALFTPPFRAVMAVFRIFKHLYMQARIAVEEVQSNGLLQSRYLSFDIDNELLMNTFYENSWSILIGLLVVVALSVAAWFVSPKGENQTIWRSTLILSFASCYIMWAITFLAQWHPLIEPKMTKLRPGYSGGS